ncbi:uncharacterized protein LACBIDRAFT_314462 [Laccaria bicolor S238N-H82]|uniref:Predicted protein n=1 Tax=Laccaria bicolor (strain S238N-H82 / ATCC MYA-4686) TaxID=486041 RepID=B0DYL8_LACBS|nr:uncharacterized protein LACBIDRAFT_314462 [Laccaria bicolor S238N-H82]EDR00316.1 predicted protein [Laccaria bicolor S238N-H82]|eukprot:XP_001889068.1 predicted protein [Laccaria bicolor S238N-H82]
MSENLSNEYLSTANSRRKGLYFSSDGDVRLDAKPIGCRRVTSLPPGRVVLIFCDKTPANASLLVFESPVQSGFLMPRGVNRNRNRSAFSPEVKRPDQTAKRPQTAVFCGL